MRSVETVLFLVILATIVAPSPGGCGSRRPFPAGRDPAAAPGPGTGVLAGPRGGLVGRDARRRAVGRLLLTTAVIIITLVVQGFTLAPLVRRAGSR